MKNKEKTRITLQLENGCSLCVEASENPEYPNELYIGLIDEDGTWIQDLVMVQESYAYVKNPPLNA